MLARYFLNSLVEYSIDEHIRGLPCNFGSSNYSRVRVLYQEMIAEHRRPVSTVPALECPDRFGKMIVCSADVRVELGIQEKVTSTVLLLEMLLTHDRPNTSVPTRNQILRQE